jgi:type II secretory pathway component GspD/PulD (secretin)
VIRRDLIAGLILLWMGFQCAGQSETDSLVSYSFRYNDASAVQEFVQALVGADGKVVRDKGRNALMVITTPAYHAQIAELMRQLDVPPQNVMIRVKFQRRPSENEREAGANAAVRLRGSGGRTSGSAVIHPQLRAQSSRTMEDVETVLLVASGREASLQIGVHVPYFEWLVDYGLQQGYWREKINWQHVGASLMVQPTVIGQGPNIKIKIVPELTGWEGKQFMRRRFAGMATEVMIEDGQTVQIGGLDQRRDFYNRFLSGFEQGGKEEILDIFLTPRIVQAQPPPRSPAARE